MNFNSIKHAVTSGATKFATGFKAKSPTIMVIGGTVAVITAGVVAAIETHKKLDDVIAEHKEKVSALKDIRDGVVVLDEYTTEDYAQNHYKKHLTHVYLATICKLAKVYAPAFILALIGTLSILKGHKILNDRYIAKVAECVLANQTLKEYRSRVVGQIGEEAEKQLFLNGEKAIVTNKEIDPNTGEEKDVSKEAMVGPETKMSYTYIVSKDTAVDALYGISDADFRRSLAMIVRQANQYFTRHEQITLDFFMKHWWKDEYMYSCPETMTNGWIYNEQFIRDGYDPEAPIQYEVKVIDSDPHNRKYAVTFNVQCDVYAARQLEKARNKAEKKMKRKVHATIRPAVA